MREASADIDLVWAGGGSVVNLLAHDDSQPARRSLHRVVATGQVPAGHGVDERVALPCRGTELLEAVAESAGLACRVDGRGSAAEERVLRPHHHLDL